MFLVMHNFSGFWLIYKNFKWFSGFHMRRNCFLITFDGLNELGVRKITPLSFAPMPFSSKILRSSASYYSLGQSEIGNTRLGLVEYQNEMYTIIEMS